MPEYTIEGKWWGGPFGDDGFLNFIQGNDGFARGNYSNADKSERGKLFGKFLDGKTRFKGWYTDKNHSENAKDQNLVDIRLEKDGQTISATYTEQGGPSGNWTAKRAIGRRNPDQKLSVNGVFKDKAVFERLTAPKRPSSTDREKVLSESLKKPLSSDPFADQVTTLAVGDPYDDTVARRAQSMARHGGKQMLGSPGKKRIEFNEAYEYLPEPYMDSIAIRRQRREQNKPLLRTTAVTQDRPVFRPSSSSATASRQRPNADLYLTYDPTHDSSKSMSKSSRPVSAASARSRTSALSRASSRQSNQETQTMNRTRIRPSSAMETRPPFRVSPMKRGGFGVPGILIGERSESRHSVHEYHPSEYDALRTQQLKESKQSREKLQSRPPFLGRVARNIHKDMYEINRPLFLMMHDDEERTRGVSSSPQKTAKDNTLDTANGIMDTANDTMETTAKSSQSDRKQNGLKNSTSEKGPFFSRVSAKHSILNKPLEHLPDPFVRKELQLRTSRGPSDKAVFRPSSVPKSRSTSTIALRRTNLIR